MASWMTASWRLADRLTPQFENSLYEWIAKGPWDRKQRVLGKLARCKGSVWVLGGSLFCPRIPPGRVIPPPNRLYHSMSEKELWNTAAS